jgi:aspartate/methionine/tyrosine aminotransferase
LDVEAMRGKLKPNTRLLILNFPHNPTGHHIAADEQAALVEMARAHSLYVFSDEMYRGLELYPGARLPAFADIYERAVSLCGLSKAHGLPGLRVGWLATAAPELPARWLALKDYTTICNSAPSEALAIIALRAAEKLIARNVALVRANALAAERLFTRFPQHVRWIPPLGGSIAFPEWLAAEPLEAFCERALSTRGIMIVPGAIFDYGGPHFRVGLGRKNLPEILNALEGLLAE